MALCWLRQVWKNETISKVLVINNFFLLQVRHISNYNKNDNLQLTQELNYIQYINVRLIVAVNTNYTLVLIHLITPKYC